LSVESEENTNIKGGFQRFTFVLSFLIGPLAIWYWRDILDMTDSKLMILCGAGIVLVWICYAVIALLITGYGNLALRHWSWRILGFTASIVLMAYVYRVATTEFWLTSGPDENVYGILGAILALFISPFFMLIFTYILIAYVIDFLGTGVIMFAVCFGGYFNVWIIRKIADWIIKGFCRNQKPYKEKYKFISLLSVLLILTGLFLIFFMGFMATYPPSPHPIENIFPPNSHNISTELINRAV